MKLKNADIAKMLGISKTAVSLALNNRPGVSEETRRKVFELVNANVNKSLYVDGTTNKTFLLCIHKKHGEVINDKPFFTELIESIQQEAMKQAYLLTLIHYMPGQNMQEYINYIASMPIDGMLVLATEMDYEDLQYYKQVKVPMVLIDGSFELADVDSVELDNQAAIFRAFDYAYQQGHRDIGFLKSSTYINNFGHHFDGYMKGIREYGLEKSNHPVISLPCSIDGAYKKMKEFMKNKPKDFIMPSIFLADLDFIALGAMQALKEFGYSIPEDISFIGYDDVSACDIYEPALTTTRVNRTDLGRLATERLIQIVNNPLPFYICTQVSSVLVIRKSVKSLL